MSSDAVFIALAAPINALEPFCDSPWRHDRTPRDLWRHNSGAAQALKVRDGALGIAADRR